MLSYYIAQLKINRWNVRASILRRLNFKNLGHYAHNLIDSINEITEKLFGESVHSDWWSNTSSFGGYTSSFGGLEDGAMNHIIIPIVPVDPNFQLALDDDINYLKG